VPAAGNLTAVTPPGKPAHSQSFTLSDNMASYSPPAVPGTGATSYQYNADHQLTQVDHPTGEQVGHGYDAAGRLASITTAQGVYGRTYDPNTGKLTALTAPGGQNLAMQYDGSLLTKTTWSGVVSGSYERTFDSFFRPASERVNGGAPVVFGYDDDGRMVQAGPLSRFFEPATGFLKTLTVGAVEDTWTHNAFGEVQTYTSKANGAVVYAVTYSRDNLGRLSGKVETLQIDMRG